VKAIKRRSVLLRTGLLQTGLLQTELLGGAKRALLLEVVSMIGTLLVSTFPAIVLIFVITIPDEWWL
jgi:hypothetical protein